MFAELRQEANTKAKLESESSMKTSDIYLYRVPSHLRQRASELIHKFESLWSRHLVEIQSADHYIDLIPGARLFRSQPYRAGLKQRELEAEEIHRMLAANVIRSSKF